MRGACPLLLLVLPALTLGASAKPLRIATWNLEWLVSPATTHAARLACREGRRTALPCDVALGGARSSPDFARLAHYATQLDADIIALQEVEDPATAARVFSGYRFCLSGHRLTQNLGFAVRAGVPFRCGPELEGLAVTGTLRPGMTLVVDPGGPRELHLLTVHLKSGCAQGAMAPEHAACRLLAQQLPQVGAWLSDQARAGHRHAALGDFNRSWERNGSAAALGLPDRGETGLDNPGEQAGFRSCYAGQTFTRYIDHLLIGRSGGLRIEPESFFRIRFEPQDVRRYRLSDHCPTGVVLQFTAREPGRAR